MSGIDISKEGTIILPPELIAEWGLDDTIVETYVLQQLDLTKA